MNESRETMDTVEEHTELGDLPKLMSLPKKPLTVRWQLPMNARNESTSLIALLQFSEQDYQAVLDQSPEFDRVQDKIIPKGLFENWIAPIKIKDLKWTESSDHYRLLGISARSPQLFVQTELSPFVNGSITPLGSGYIFVVLTAM